MLLCNVEKTVEGLACGYNVHICMSLLRITCEIVPVLHAVLCICTTLAELRIVPGYAELSREYTVSLLFFFFPFPLILELIPQIKGVS